MLNRLHKPFKLYRRIRLLKSCRRRIEAHQWRKLKSIINHAYATVPYYRDLLSRHSLRPDDIRCFRDLAKIPFTSKQDLASLDRSRITSDAYPPETLDEIHTSGSTGEPMRFLSTQGYGEHVGLDCMRSKILHGMRPTDRILRIGGDTTRIEPPANRLKRLFFRRATLSSFTAPREILRFYNRFRPDVIRGFASSLYLFALWLEQHRIRPDHAPKFILCTAETAHAYMREKIAAVFETRVVDRYATAELGVVADSCDVGEGYHVFEDSVYPEYIQSNGRTYFVGTNLDNYATPFIRYSTGDICNTGAWTRQRCSCGLNTLKFSRITGRSNDFIRTPDGRLLPPMHLIFFMRKYYRFIKKFRFIQNDPETIVLELVADEILDESTRDALAAGLTDLTGGLVTDVRIVKRIALDKSGKMRIIQNRAVRKSSYPGHRCKHEN